MGRTSASGSRAVLAITDLERREKFAEQYPGMRNVCLLHANGELWRSGGTPGCACEALSDPAERLQGQIRLIRRDGEEAAVRELGLKKELRNPASRLGKKLRRKYPGMASVCLWHSDYPRGGSQDCACETVDEARERLHGEILFAQEDRVEAAAAETSLREELRVLEEEPDERRQRAC